MHIDELEINLDDLPIENPFLNSDRINFPPLSSDIFENIDEETEGPFRWSIEHIAEIDPTEIEPTIRHKIIDYSMYKDVQEKVDEYFSSLALPSPWTPARRVINLDISTVYDTKKTPTKFPQVENYTITSFQTDLSFKPTFDLEQCLPNESSQVLQNSSLEGAAKVNLFGYKDQSFLKTPNLSGTIRKMTCSDDELSPCKFPDILSPVESVPIHRIFSRENISENYK